MRLLVRTACILLALAAAHLASQGIPSKVLVADEGAEFLEDEGFRLGERPAAVYLARVSI